VIEHWAKLAKQTQGRRTDLTSTQTCVEVPEKPSRYQNTTEKVAKLFGESEGQTRKRLDIAAAAAADPARFGKLVEDMDRTGCVNGVHKLLKVARQAEAIRKEPPPLPGNGPYRVGVVDPPWPCDARAHDPSRRGVPPYPTMSLDQIKALPIASLMHSDSILWMWVTNHYLLNGVAKQILDAWEFTPRALLTWAKDRMGLGDWLRGQTEHCVLATRGKPVVASPPPSSLLHGKAREHSRKPDEFYALVEQLCPAPRYVEFFAREARSNWDGHGDEYPLAQSS
jgi:N6-adenosine-specific RNA methylase IME4